MYNKCIIEIPETSPFPIKPLQCVSCKGLDSKITRKSVERTSTSECCRCQRTLTSSTTMCGCLLLLVVSRKPSFITPSSSPSEQCQPTAHSSTDNYTQNFDVETGDTPYVFVLWYPSPDTWMLIHRPHHLYKGMELVTVSTHQCDIKCSALLAWWWSWFLPHCQEKCSNQCIHHCGSLEGTHPTQSNSH